MIQRRSDPDPYTTLGVSPYATPDEIRRAYHDLARRYHPDANPPEKKAQAEAQMRQVNAAYALLSDPVRRAQYDETHPPPSSPKPPPPIEPIRPDEIRVDLRGDVDFFRRAMLYFGGVALAMTLVCAGTYYGLVGAESAPPPPQTLGEFLLGQRVLSLGGLLTFTVGELGLTLLGIFVASLPLAWLWLRR